VNAADDRRRPQEATKETVGKFANHRQRIARLDKGLSSRDNALDVQIQDISAISAKFQGRVKCRYPLAESPTRLRQFQRNIFRVLRTSAEPEMEQVCPSYGAQFNNLIAILRNTGDQILSSQQAMNASRHGW
jgi:hypothetical protein